MNRNWLFREVAEIALLVLAASFAGVLMVSAGSCVVGGRAPSPSQSNSTDSGMAPARPLATGASGTVVGGDGGSAPLVDTTPLSEMASGWIPAPASTVTQSALTATAYTAIDHVPATPVSTPARVETIAPQSIKSYEPWPAYLWPTVACLIERESGGLEWKVSPGGDVGLMQVGPANFEYLAERGITRAMLFDGPTNLRAGWMLYQFWQGVNGDGLTPWKSTRGGCA